MAMERFRVRKDMEGPGILPQGRPRWRCHWPVSGREEQDLSLSGLWGLTVISFSKVLCVIREVGSRE